MADKRKIVAAGTIKGGVVAWIKSREHATITLKIGNGFVRFLALASPLGNI